MKVFAGAAASALLLALTGPVPALADTIEAALVRAYQTNPQLNAHGELIQQVCATVQATEPRKSSGRCLEGFEAWAKPILPRCEVSMCGLRRIPT